MKYKMQCSILFMIVSLYLSGCAGYDRILFVTKTNIGLDVDNKPPTAEVTIARRELAIAPTFKDSTSDDDTLPLLASFGLTGGFLDPEISSRFAGGKAAVILAQGPNANGTSNSSSICLSASEQPDTRPLLKRLWEYFFPSKNGETRAFYFATDTSFGLKLGWDGTSGPYPDTLKLGYNRKELAFPPVFVTEGCSNSLPAAADPAKKNWKVTVPSFVASLENSSTIKDWSSSGNTHIQFFATGKAASDFVSRPEVNAAMNKTMYPHNELSINPAAAATTVFGTQTFQVASGTGLVKFTIMHDTSGGAKVDASTGLYNAGPNAGTSVVGAADEAGKTAVARVAVNPALTIVPTSENVVHGQPVQFKATGGVPPLKFAISDDQSGGATINEKTGLYKAGSTSGKTDKVKVIDSSTPPISIEATVNVQ